MSVNQIIGTLAARGWKVRIEGGDSVYTVHSPVSPSGEWVTVIVAGRSVRTVASWASGKRPARGARAAMRAAQILGL